MKAKFYFALLSAFCLFLISPEGTAQKDSILFALNGRTPNGTLIRAGHALSTNPFARFVGDWTLKQDKWIQNWGGTTDTVVIKNHHTVTRVLNTDNSLLSIIDGPEPNGHIFWSYNPVTQRVDHSSSFGSSRIGQGEGRVDTSGNVSLKISFEGEAAGTYRLYKYTWVNDDEYEMTSVQYDENGERTGLFYAGTFVRVDTDILHENKIREEIIQHGDKIRTAFYNGDTGLIKALHHPEVVKALGYNNVKHGRAAVMRDIEAVLANYTLEFVENTVENFLIRGNTVLEQSKFSIKGTPKKKGDPFTFNGRTMVTYIRYPDSLTGWATIREIIQPAEQ